MTEQIIIFFQIVFIDLVLAGDNAIVIGMVASQFPIDQRKKIIFFGIAVAIILRIIFTLITAYLLQITGLRLIGGILLLYICYRLYADVIKNSSEENKNIKELVPNSIVGTSSYRREFQLKKIREDLNYKLIRGNVDTRIKKLNDNLYDAIILSMLESNH